MPLAPLRELRAARRAKCHLRAIVRSGGKPFTGTIIDMSVMGCRIRLAGEEAVQRLGNALEILILDQDLKLIGSLAWRNGRHIGVQFDLARFARTISSVRSTEA